MRVGYPIVFVRDRVEHAAVVCKQAPERGPGGEPLKDLVVDLAFYNPVTHTWSTVCDVSFLSADLKVPAVGDYFYETGAPDPAERDRFEYVSEEMQRQIAAAGDGEEVGKPLFSEREELPFAACPTVHCVMSANHEGDCVINVPIDAAATEANGGYAMPPAARESFQASSGDAADLDADAVRALDAAAKQVDELEVDEIETRPLG